MSRLKQFYFHSFSRAVVLCVFLLVSCSSANQTGSTPTFPPPGSTLPALEKATGSVHFTPTVKSVPTKTTARTQTAELIKTSTATHYANAESIPDVRTVTWEEMISGFDSPTGITNAGDGSGRLFIIEKAGLVRMFQDEQVLPEPFIDLRDRVRTQGYTTAGLLGIAFHPRYKENGIFFVFYVAATGNSVIARFYSTPDHIDGDPSSEQILLSISQPVGEHRGGNLVFGPDGFLYASIGDGGAAGYGDSEGNAQNPDSLLGKILRLDVDNGTPYAIPPGNPFVAGGGLPEVWLTGLRNPWRLSFDSSTGNLYIADVGENTWEEVNFLPAGDPGGANFGWNLMEGSERFKGKLAGSANITDPVWEYDHTQGCSITGGVVYRGEVLPDWQGVYFYGDYCQGNIWVLLRKPDATWENKLLTKIPAFITSFGLDEAGEIYLADITGKIFKLVSNE